MVNPKGPSCAPVPAASARFVWSDGNSSLRTLRQKWVSADGIIVGADCRAELNGGCYTKVRRTWTPRSNVDLRTWTPSHPLRRSVPLAVTIAMQWGYGMFHFPMEAMVALAAVEPPLLRDAALHVARRSEFVRQWLEVAAPLVNWSHVVEGDIYARTLHVPKPGRCSKPSTSQIGWLRRAVLAALRRPTANEGSAITLRPLGHMEAVGRAAARPLRRSAIAGPLGHLERSSAPALVVVKRSNFSQNEHLNQHRSIRDFDDAVVRPSAEFAAAHGLRLELHNDAALPPVIDQLRLFSRAAIVVAPLGAGEVNLIATPAGACVVELVDPCLFEATRGGCDGKPHVDPTYQRICGILGIRHTVVPTPGLVADAAKVRAALRDCGGGRTALSRLHHDST